MRVFVGAVTFIIIMKGIFTFLLVITMIAILCVPLIIKAFFSIIFIPDPRLVISAFLEITFGSIMMFVSSEVLVEITFLVVLVIEIGTFFIFILVVDFMKAAGLLPLFVVRRLPIAATLLTSLSLVRAPIILRYVATPFFVPSFDIVIFCKIQ